MESEPASVKTLGFLGIKNFIYYQINVETINIIRSSYFYSYSCWNRDDTESGYRVLADSRLRPFVKGSIISQILETIIANQPLAAYALKFHNNLVNSKTNPPAIRRVLHLQYIEELTKVPFQVIVYLYIAVNEYSSVSSAVAIYLTDKKPTSKHDHLYKFNVQHNVQEECRKYDVQSITHIFIETETIDHEEAWMKSRGLYYLTQYMLVNEAEIGLKRIFVYCTRSIKVPRSSRRREFELASSYILQGSKWSDCVDLIVDSLILTRPAESEEHTYVEKSDEFAINRQEMLHSSDFGQTLEPPRRTNKRKIQASNLERVNTASLSQKHFADSKKIIVLENVLLPLFAGAANRKSSHPEGNDEAFNELVCFPDRYTSLEHQLQ